VRQPRYASLVNQSPAGQASFAVIVAPDSRGRAGVNRPERGLRDERFRPPAPSPVISGPTEDDDNSS